MGYVPGVFPIRRNYGLGLGLGLELAFRRIGTEPRTVRKATC